jgi:hypothetical protein
VLSRIVIRSIITLFFYLSLFHFVSLDSPIMRYYTAGLALLAGLTAAVDPVEVRGQDFVNSVTGDRFVIIGVDYQPGGQGAISANNDRDVLSDAEACTRDAALMQSLGVNTLRSYNVDPVGQPLQPRYDLR